MSKSRKSLRSPKTRKLHFEVMEDRLYLSATDPNFSLESKAIDIEQAVISQIQPAVTLESGGVTQTVQTESSSKSCGGCCTQEQALSTINIRKIQDGYVTADGRSVQNLIFEFERTIDPNDPHGLDRELTVVCYEDYDHYEEGFNEIDQTTQRTGGIKLAVIRTALVTFKPGETKAYLEIKSYRANTSYSYAIMPPGSFSIMNTGKTDEYAIGTERSASGYIHLQRDNLDQQPVIVNIKKIQDAVVDSSGQIVQNAVFELERTVDPNDSRSIDRPLTVKYHFIEPRFQRQVLFFQDKINEVTFQPGETKIRFTCTENEASRFAAAGEINCIIIDSLPELNGGTAQYIHGENRIATAKVQDNAESIGMQKVQLTDIQSGTAIVYQNKDELYPNNAERITEVTGNIIFMFERIADPSDPSALDRPLTMTFEYWKSYLFNTDGFCYRPGSKHIG
ncbi:MAG: hypothetical protein ACRC2T_19890, partial [Thermoguttaceae bacterium]